MNVLSLIGIILGSNVAIEVVKAVLNRREAAASLQKLNNETGSLVLDGELKVSEFYKKEWQDILKRNAALENKIAMVTARNEKLLEEMKWLQVDINDLKRQITLLKTIQD